MHHLNSLLTMIMTLAAIGSWAAIWVDSAEASVSFSLNEPSTGTPTSCLASGKSCVGEQSLANGLIVNPAALASPGDRSSNAWHLNIGNLSESLTSRSERRLQIDSREGSVGWAAGWGRAGIGVLASMKNAIAKFDASEFDPESARTQSSFGTIGVRGALRVSNQLSIGISYTRYGVLQNFALESSNRANELPELQGSYFGNAPTIGLLVGNFKQTSIGLVYRPQIRLQDSSDNLQTSGSAARGVSTAVKSTRQAYQQISANGFRQASILIPERVTLGLDTVLIGQRSLVFRSDISMLSPVKNAYELDPKYLLYLTDESELSPTPRRYKLAPGAGLSAKLPAVFFFSQISTGAYYDETLPDQMLGELHRTVGLSRSYRIFDFNLSFDIAYDVSESGRRMVLNLF